MSSLVFAQFSDCHLYADKSALHFGQNVYQNLSRVLNNIASQDDIQFAIFSGDLSQDHSVQSYLNFVDAVESSDIDIPIYWIAGNHDDIAQMQELLVHPLIVDDKLISRQGLDLLLLDSKSATPAGLVTDTELARIHRTVEHTLLFMHHHPVSVNYFIDRHGLQNSETFWQCVNQESSVIGVACGHVHRGLTIPASPLNQVPVYTCPATSIQFDPEYDGVKALPQGPAYRLFHYQDSTLSTQIEQLSFEGSLSARD